MPSYQATYEDTAPFFTYAGAWIAGRSSQDDQAEKYSETSFSVTEASGASFSFPFYGTEVSIFGSRRGNHGLYQVTLDSTTFTEVSGSVNPDQFNVSLFTTTVNKGAHTVMLTNKENKFLDVDYVSWTTSVGRDDEPLIVNTFQDSHPSFVYTPASAWTTPPSVGTFSGSSGHSTSVIGASAQLTFQVRDAIALYGSAGPNGASSYSVSLTGRPTSQHSAFKLFPRSQQLLYYGSNLGPGSHTVTLKMESPSDTNRTQNFAIDYAEVFTAPSLGGRFDTSTGTSTRLPTGVIVGLAITTILSILSLSILSFIFYLYKKRRFNFAPFVKPGLSSDPGHSESLIHGPDSPYYTEAAAARTSQVQLPPGSFTNQHPFSGQIVHKPQYSYGGAHVNPTSVNRSTPNSVSPRQPFRFPNTTSGPPDLLTTMTTTEGPHDPPSRLSMSPIHSAPPSASSTIAAASPATSARSNSTRKMRNVVLQVANENDNSTISSGIPPQPGDLDEGGDGSGVGLGTGVSVPPPAYMT